MNEEKKNRNRWMHVRLTEEEYNKLHKKFTKTTCRKLSDYTRRVLLDKSVPVTIRNQSQDDLMAELIKLKNELNAIGANYNQLVKRLHQLNHNKEVTAWLQLHESARKILLLKMDEIKSKIYSIYDQWLQE